MSASLPIIPDTTEERTLREVRKVLVRDFRSQKTRAVVAHLVLGQAAEFLGSYGWALQRSRRQLVRDGGRLGLAIFGQAFRDMGSPISGQYLGFVGLVGAFALPDLLGTALFRGFAIFGSDGFRIDQPLGKGGLTKDQCSDKTQVPKRFQGRSPWLAVRLPPARNPVVQV